MRLLGTALALSTLFLTACADDAEVRAIPVAPDQAPLDACPDSFPVAPHLRPLAPFQLPDGRWAVLLDTVIARETPTANFLIEARGAWHACRSSVTYVEDWKARLGAGQAVLP